VIRPDSDCDFEQSDVTKLMIGIAAPLSAIICIVLFVMVVWQCTKKASSAKDNLLLKSDRLAMLPNHCSEYA
jgi:hypothetical protein